MAQRTIRMEIEDLEDILRKNGDLKGGEFLEHIHIEPGEMVVVIVNDDPGTIE